MNTILQRYAISRVLIVWQSATPYEEFLQLLRSDSSTPCATIAHIPGSTPRPRLAELIEEELEAVTKLLAEFNLKVHENSFVTFTPRMVSASFSYCWEVK